MPRLGLLLALVALAPSASAQSADSTGAAPTVHDLADVQPEIVGGMAALAASIVYPEAAWVDRIEGTVIVQVVVDEQGEVLEALAVRSPSEVLSHAALAAVRQQRFTPGRVGDQPVAVRITLPIRFRLPENDPERIAPRAITLTPRPASNEVYLPDDLDVQPELIGGQESIRTEYPIRARRSGIQGRVVVQFVVNEVGEPVDLEVARSPHDLLTGAALDTVRRLRFTPGEVGGQPVKVQFSFPVTFRAR